MTNGRIVYTVLIALIGLSIFLIPKIDISGSIFAVPEKSEYNSLLKQTEERFPDSSYIRVFFKRKPGEDADNYYRQLEECTLKYEQVEWADIILSPTRLEDINIDSTQITSEVIYDETEESALELDRILHEDSLFRKFFLPKKVSAGSYMYIFYPTGTWNRSYFLDLERVNKGYHERKVFLMGMEIFEEHISNLGVNELLKLGSIAVVIVLLVEMIFFHSLLYGIVFSMITFVPALYVMTFFPLLEIPFSVYFIPVPLLTIVLSTTYTLHIVFYASAKPEIPFSKNMRSIFPIVFAAAITTLLGFLTMLFSSLQWIRQLGILMSAGVGLSLIVAWFAVPPLIPGYSRWVSSQDKKWSIPQPKAMPVVLLVLFVLSTLGLLAYEEHHFILRMTVRNNDLREYNDFSYKLNGASHQFSIMIDTKKEFGFVSEQKYNALQRAQRDFEELPYGSEILSISHFVDWINGKIEGNNGPLTPKDEYQIGEALEILHTSNPGFHLSSMITTDYSAVRVQAFVDARDNNSWKSNLSVERVKKKLQNLFQEYFPDAEIIVLSEALQIMDAYNYVKKGIITSLLLFYPMVFLFLLLIFRKAFVAFVAILPSIFSALAYLGLMGYFGFYFSIYASVSICMLIGVCIDDSVVLVQFYMKHRQEYVNAKTALRETLNEVGSVIIKTTVIIVLGISVQLFSSYRETLQNSALLIITFIFATMLTLFFVPAVISLKEKGRDNG